MANKSFWVGMLVMVLVFGMTAVGCDDSTDDKGTTYDPNGTWDFVISGQNASVAINGTSWVFYFNGVENDTGTYTKSGNLGTLYSNSASANIGTATMTSNTTMVLTLHSPSYFTGTFNGVKR
jgi:hypothetical protein